VTFVSPTWLIALALVPVFALFLLWRGWARRAAVERLGDRALVQPLLAQINYTARGIKAVLWLIALAALILAIARPTWGFTIDRLTTQGIQIMIAMDVSRSMAAEDISPNRLERAKLDVLDLINQLPRTEYAFIIFAREAYVYMPLTFDAEAGRVFLEGIDTDMLTLQGTDLAKTIEVALAAFDQRPGAERVLLIISDGETHEEDPREAAQRAAENDVTIYTMGYATQEGGLIPLYNEAGELVDYQADAAGRLVQTTLNPDVLQRIANITGGEYLPYSANNAHSAEFIAAMNEMQGGDLREEEITRPIERFGWFVALALLALSVEILLPETKREAKSI